MGMFWRQTMQWKSKCDWFCLKRNDAVSDICVNNKQYPYRCVWICLKNYGAMTFVFKDTFFENENARANMCMRFQNKQYHESISVRLHVDSPALPTHVQ